MIVIVRLFVMVIMVMAMWDSRIGLVSMIMGCAVTMVGMLMVMLEGMRMVMMVMVWVFVFLVFMFVRMIVVVIMLMGVGVLMWVFSLAHSFLLNGKWLFGECYSPLIIDYNIH